LHGVHVTNPRSVYIILIATLRCCSSIQGVTSLSIFQFDSNDPSALVRFVEDIKPGCHSLRGGIH
jgi:hypothetical protein